MRQPSSTYAPRVTQDIETDRQRRIRMAHAKAERQRTAMERLDDATVHALTIYQTEKARAASKGKPVLLTYDDWRGERMSKQSTETGDA